MKKNVFVKKIKISPLGDKEEVNRVYEYLRDAIYKQYIALNRYMSEVGTLYYRCNRDISSVEWKQGYREIFLSSNPLIQDIEQPKGLGMYSTVSMKIKQDFSTALKGGLAKGERSLPFYKRDFPLMVSGRFLNFYKTSTNEGREIYAIKFVNKINFKVILGSRGLKDSFFISTLESLCSDIGKYKICASQISVDKGDIYLYLTLMSEYEDNYEPIKDKKMGISLGYSKPIACAFNNNDEACEIGSPDEFLQKRINIQTQIKRLQKNASSSTGGHGRLKKLHSLENARRKERNFVRYYNHILSKKIVELAKEKKTQTIIIEDMNMDKIKDYPVMLRNWSYFQLIEFIKYKAKLEGIEVIITDAKNYADVCCTCGEKIDIISSMDEESNEWSGSVTCSCSNCNNIISYSYNKAKNIANNI